MTTPLSVHHEHQALNADLDAAMATPGRVGEAARTLARVMHPHFMREERYATAPLGLLRPLAEGRVTASMTAVLDMTDRLKTELPLMLREHQAIEGALDELAAAADAESRPDISAFVERLRMHAHLEEEVLYPAAILVGEFVRLKLCP